MNTATFRVSTDILRRLGEELITSFDQGIVELVKNSYDADAINCKVELKGTDEAGGTVVISDDGDGMSLEDIRDGWLVVGRSRKVTNSRTSLGRLPSGSKGLGRLAALRMGDQVRLVTRPREGQAPEYSMSIQWDDFATTDVVEDVRFGIEQSEPTMDHGTRLEIGGLRSAIGQEQATRLARELILLSDPFGDPSGFNPKFVSPQFSHLEGLVSDAYFDDCTLRLDARVTAQGVATARVFDRLDQLRWVTEKEDLDNLYRTPSAKFELWVFILDAASFAGRRATVSEVRSWLREVGGVHLYHRGLRVRPYGDLGHDWLDMNLSRARDPELRPSTNTSVGRVTVIDENEELLQKTDRTGFVENESFKELRRFAIDALEWMQGKRLAEREANRTKRKLNAPSRTTKAKQRFREAVGTLSTPEQTAVLNAASEFESAGESEREALQEDLSLYQTLASVGTAVSVFAHEIEGPATNLTSSVDAVERRAKKALGSKYAETIGHQVTSVKDSARLLARFATLPLALLRRSKRRPTVVNVNSAVSELVNLFDPYLRDARIQFSCELAEENVQVNGSVAAFEAIMSNLITNSVKAFRRANSNLAERRLAIRTSVTQQHVLITVLDSGPGIPSRLGDRIWLPGITSDENGTGLGLTIVRDTVSELGGTASVTETGELGGAEFLIELPRALAY